MRLLPLLLAAALLPLAAHAQSSSGGGSSSGGASSSGSMGGSSGSARTESAPSGTLRTGPDRGPGNAGGGSATMGGGSATLGEDTTTMDRGTSERGPATLGTPGGGTAPGSSGRGSGQQARVPDECGGPVTDPRCPTASAPTGTGLGDRGVGGSDPRPYGPSQSPVQGGPPFTGPTGLPLDLPAERR